MIGFLAVIIAAAPLYLIRFNISSLPTTLLEVLIVAFLFLRLLLFTRHDFTRIKNLGFINYAIGAFILAGIINTLVSPEPVKALGLLKAFIIEPVLIFYAILITLKNKDHLTIILKTLFFSSVIVSILGILQYFTFIGLPLRFWGNGEEVLRITSIFEYPNALSLYLAPLFGLFLTLWLNQFSLSKNRWVSGAGLGLMAIALLMTFSRGAWIAVALALLLVFIKQFKFKKTILSLIFCGILLLLIPGVRQRLSVGVTDASSSAHWDLVKIGFNKIADNPIFGNGLFGFQTTLAQSNYPGELNYPHNILLNFWVELGLLGLLSFVCIVYLAYTQYKKTPDLIKMAAGVYLLIFLIHGLVDVPYFKNDLALLFWFVISLFYL